MGVELVKTKDEALRTLADAQNIKRRAEADIDKAQEKLEQNFICNSWQRLLVFRHSVRGDKWWGEMRWDMVIRDIRGS